MAGTVLFAVVSAAALLTTTHGAKLSFNKQVKQYPTCSGPSSPFPNPVDCSTYYQCMGVGRIALLSCPPGLQFSAQNGLCDYPQNAKCKESSSPNGADTSANNEKPFDHGGSSSVSSSLPQCPYPADPNIVVHFPNPDDCSSFYKCGLDGKPVLIPCPEGLEWNAATEACDYPESAHCTVSSGNSGSAAEGKPAGTSNTPPPECPYPADLTKIVRYPNPDNCSTFYYCGHDGEPVIIICPRGLEYNAEAQVCDFPASAGCSISSDSSSSSEKPAGTPNTPPPKCPYPADPNVVVQFPNPDDCSSFYKCGLDGTPVLIPCPQGLEWNAATEACDYPESAHCTVSSGNSGSAAESKPAGTSNTPPPECPYPADPNVVVQFPNPDDCSSFYKCGLDGTPVLIPCPQGLEWNAATEACDYPESAHCTVSSGNSGSAAESKPAGTSNTPPPECPYPADPNVVVQFPNPDDCSSFYKCGLDGTPVLIPCPQGLEWNAATEACDYPESAHCTVSSGNSGSAAESKPAGTSNTPPPECPYPADPNVVVQFPNPDDCSSFYKCGLDGTPVLIPCPQGLEWNAATEACDYPESAHCTVSSGNSGSAAESKPAGTSNTPPPECPYPADPNVVVQFPNPDDCSSFYKCGLDGTPVLIPCPQGLEWNAATEACDYPESAHCTVSSGNSGSAAESKPAGTSNTPPPECPYPADPNVVVQFPNPDDCSSFYKCGLDGTPVLIPCPQGLEWNAATEACDYPESAHCTISSGNSGSAAESKPAGTSNTPPPECPYPADPNVVVQFPNPDDCSSFYKCGLDGTPVLIPCPQGLEWNAATEACDYPESAHCTVSSGNSGSAAESKPAGTSNTPPPECPYPADPNVVVQFPNPDDCSSFYKCGLDGTPVLIPCPQGLEWNAATEACDYPESAHCTVSSGNSGSAAESKPAGTSNTPPPECPYPADPNVVVQFPNPDDCSRFYKCGLDGTPVLIPCPQGLEWNAATEACDYPESAHCTVSSGNSGSAAESKPAGTSNTPPPECPYPADPNVVVQFPNPDDCSSFYKCGLDGTPVLIPCPQGLEWNAATEACDYPESAHCTISSGNSGSAAESKPAGTSNTPPPECPYPADPNVVVQFPNPDDCSSFYKCGLDGTPVLIPCPQGLEWNAATEACDYPESAHCTVSSGNSGSAAESKPAGTSNTPPPECPYPADPNVVVQFPNPDDCSSFYKCGLDGTPVLIPCPQGLEWNAATEACDYPESAHCTVSSGNSGSAAESKPSGTSNTPPPECPYPADPNVVVQFPNPDDCSSFYKCGLDGTPVLIPCPQGLEWNAATEACDYPESAHCAVSSGNSGSAVESKPAGTSNTPPPECPYPADPNVVVQFPNPDDCSSFYKCGLDGTPVLIPCPQGLDWNAATEACDYPESAHCTVSSGNSGSAAESKPAGTSNTPPPECPYPADPNVVVQFPNPDDCSSFYKCGLDGKPVLIPCPQGLEWNAATEACDYPESAHCTVSSGNSGSAAESKPAGTSNTPPPECPYPADPNVVVQFPNPDDCSSFYKCGLDGKPVLIPCPQGLEWNAATEACDYPESAHCTVSSGNKGSAAESKPAGTSNTPPPECPYPADPNVVVQFPNPDDCSSFYKCGLDGKPVLIPCPQGLEWNAANEACDYPESAHCTVSSGNSGSAAESKPAGTSNTPPPECPYPADPANIVQYPNPDNCSTFYKCGLDGEPVLITCPEGLEYNAEAQVCDFPATAGCSVSRK